MFFKKQKSLPQKKSQKILIIGDSPLAFFLAHTLQINDISVSFLIRPQNSMKPKLDKHLMFKNTSFQTTRFLISYTDDLLTKADFCIIASSLEKYKQDFLLLQNLFSNNIPILNFAHIYNHRLFANYKEKNIIPAYFTGWLNYEKEMLEMVNNKSIINLCCSPKDFENYKTLFKNPLIEIKNISPQKFHLWKHLAPFIISNLLLAAHPKDLSKTLSQKDNRDLVSSAIKEVCALAEKENETLKESDLSAYLYTIPTQYKSEFLKQKSLFTLLDTLPQISYFETPSLYKLFCLANTH